MGTVAFGRYRIQEPPLGRGGMGVVHRAQVDGPHGFSRACVVKRLLPHLCGDPVFTQAMVAEARLSGLLHHPSIVQVYEFGEIDGEFYLAMEYVDGVSLVDVGRACQSVGRAMPPSLVAYMGAELAAALDYAHHLTDGNGRPLDIVHRDLSPSNVMLTRAGGVKLLDFGIAKAAAHVREEQTRTGTLKGKFSYMSPEQASGLPLDGRSDLFSLGVVLHEMLTLKRLFKGGDDLDTLRLVREAAVTPTGVDGELDAVVARLLARDPAQRFARGDEVARALSPLIHRLHGDAGAMRAFLDEIAPALRTSAPRSTQIATVGGRSHSKVSGEMVSMAPTPTSPRRPSWLWTAGAFVVVAVVALAALKVRNGARPAATATQPAATAPPATPSTATPPSHAAGPATVALELHGTTGAEVFIDGAPAGVLPLELKVPSLARARKIEVRLAGYQPFVQSVAGDQSVTLNTVLRRRPEPRPRHAAPPGSPTSPIKDPF